ncbi:hypothetical protein AcV7_001353 [Taiwanofungus camphoratus]|nr:hypothetical protein AcV7_001353 [Antrodia cinnamomea]
MGYPSFLSSTPASTSFNTLDIFTLESDSLPRVNGKSCHSSELAYPELCSADRSFLWVQRFFLYLISIFVQRLGLFYLSVLLFSSTLCDHPQIFADFRFVIAVPLSHRIIGLGLIEHAEIRRDQKQGLRCQCH